MNYLAHIYLSGEDDQLKIGNFIADSIKGRKFLHYPERIQKGIILHRAIDYYTDTHPVFRKSSQRLFPKYRHYSGVIVDILYDHFLAANWKKYSSVPLETYVDQFYQMLNAHFDILPKKVQRFLPVMIENNWLLNYATIEGIGKILYQMNMRTGNKSKMNFAVEDLQNHYEDFKKEFFEFFEDLRDFTQRKLPEL
ncbi:MAG: acyl carrier protein phosphodiesterase [Salegentibacter sp.]